eukprot:353666-Chlamydomonas_euryale.AAC.3
MHAMASGCCAQDVHDWLNRPCHFVHACVACGLQALSVAPPVCWRAALIRRHWTHPMCGSCVWVFVLFQAPLPSHLPSHSAGALLASHTVCAGPEPDAHHQAAQPARCRGPPGRVCGAGGAARARGNWHPGGRCECEVWMCGAEGARGASGAEVALPEHVVIGILEAGVRAGCGRIERKGRGECPERRWPCQSAG